MIELHGGGFYGGVAPNAYCDGKGRDPKDGYACQCLLGGGEARFGKIVATSCQAALAFLCPELATR